MNWLEPISRGPKFWRYRFMWWLVDKFDYTPKHPLHVDIELAKQCNLKCTMCSYSDPEWPTGGMMDTKLAKSIIDQCGENGVFSIKLQFRGESSLHKDLVEIVDYAKRKGILEVQMNTNGIPYTLDKVEGLVKAGLDRLIVSIDGATPKTYSKIRVGGDLDKVERTLRWFREWKGALDTFRPYIRIQMTQQDDNDQEVKAFKQKWSKYGEINVKPVRSRNTGERRRCPQPFQRMIYGWDGTVYACCNAWNDESEIKHKDFPGKADMQTIWSNFYMMNLMRKRARFPNVEEPCKSCQVRSSYK